MDLLEGIEDVYWAEWEHAYGPATDFPELARMLLIPGKAGRAQYELYGNIIHQGTVYPATQHAIVWLLKLLAPESVADRAWLLSYLLDLAWGNSYMRQHAHLDDDGSPEYAAQMAQEISYVDGARAAVVAGFPAYLSILKDGDTAEVAAALDLLVAVPELLTKLTKEAWSDFEALLKHPDQRLRTKAVMGLGWIPDFDLVKQEIEAANADESECVKWAAAWASGYHRQFTQDVVDRLVHAMLDPEPMDTILRGVLNHSVGQKSMAPLLSAPEGFHPKIIEAMEVQLNRAKSIEATEAARLMLLLVFGRTPAPSSKEDFSPAQMRVLRSVAECNQAWIFSNMSDYLRSWELPATRPGLREFVEGT